ncbi:MAG: lycopene cyclase domain-containing protein [Deltaproteobacteria bacterium]|nr:lycopene cyclase domain-containing protein [Deltaproteobacteria bacterium]
MSYVDFLLIFVVPAVLAAGWAWRARARRGDVVRMATLCAVAFVAAYPWDRHAVLGGYWRFPTERVAGWLGPLPVEECAYFMLETVGVALLTLHLLRKRAS